MYRYDEKRAVGSFLLPFFIYGTLLTGIFFLLYPRLYLLKHGVIIGLTIFAFWRYGWMLLNYLRALLYRYYYYPKLLRAAEALPESAKYPKNLYFMIPSYKEESWVSVECFRSILSEIRSIPSDVTIVIATSGKQEDAVIHRMFQAYDGGNRVRLIFQHQNSGKRLAMGHALRAIARAYHKAHFDDPNSVTIFMDGDSYLEKGFLRKILPFFASEKGLGALTTNEVAFIHSKNRWYKEWFNLKFGQRHLLFQAHSLSRKVMTLTGRMSAYRTQIVVKESFIRQIENDIITDPMHGKFRFLMGDDKSTWYYLLKHGWDMLYIPDALCVSLESRDGSFWELSRSLPYRWFGNTLRNNTRALKLGPRKTGWYIWYAILEQRLIMWTSLVGVTSALILSIVYSWWYMLFFVVWVIMVRLVQLFVIAFFGHPVDWRMVPLLLYTQWVGALVKIRAFYNLADQSWSKNSSALQRNDTQRVHINSPFVTWLPKVAMFSTVTLFVTVLLVTHGALKLPPVEAIKNFLASAGNGSMSLYATTLETKRTLEVIDLSKEGIRPGDHDIGKKINTIIGKLAPDKVVELYLPAGIYAIRTPICINRDRLILRGAGKGKTILRAYIKRPHHAVIEVGGKRLRRLGYLKHNLFHNQTRFFASFSKPPSPFLLIRQPNDPLFLQVLGTKRWHRRYPYLRQEIVEVLDYEPMLSKVYTKRPVLTDFSAGKAEVFALEMTRNVTLRDFTLIQVNEKRHIRAVRHIYRNLAPDLAVDAIDLHYAAHCRLENLEIRQSGSHPVSLDYAYAMTLKGLTIDGSWNKGKKGNGYVRFARTFYSLFTDSIVKNIRHITIQWSSAGNRLSHLISGVDINFHGGFTHDNRVDHIHFVIPRRHKWQAFTFCPPDAHWAPPDGKNLIDYATIRITTPPKPLLKGLAL